jgi:hypothetical protein
LLAAAQPGIMGSVAIALVLTGLGALGTALGGLLVVIQPNLSFKRLGAIQVGVQHLSAATRLHSRTDKDLPQHRLGLQLSCVELNMLCCP